MLKLFENLTSDTEGVIPGHIIPTNGRIGHTARELGPIILGRYWLAAIELQHLGDQVPPVPARPDGRLPAPDLVVPLVPGDLGRRVGVARHAVELQPLAHRAVGDLGGGALLVPPDLAQVQSRPARRKINLKTDKSISISVLRGADTTLGLGQKLLF